MRSSSTPAPWGRVIAIVVGLTALVSVALLAFAWPALNTAPRDVPVALAAPPPIATQIEGNLARSAEGALDVAPVADRAAAVSLIEDREVYGAIVVGPEGAEVLTASAASPAVAQLLADVAAKLGEAQNTPVRVSDVVPLPDEDPRGVGLAAGALPLVLGGIATASALRMQVPGRGRRVAGVLAVGVVGGMAMVAILQGWFGVLDGSYWANAGVVSLAIAATAAALLGLERVAGLHGMVLGGATVLLLGSPLSGLTSAPELLPSGWGALGQLLPPGAAGTALRSTAYFDGAGAGTALLVLATWVVVGLVLMLLPVRRATAETAPVEREPLTASVR